MHFGKLKNQPLLGAAKNQNKAPNILLFAGIVLFVILLVSVGYFFLFNEQLANIPGQSNELTTLSIFGSSGWKTGLIIGHLIGLMLGFGVAVFLDLYLLRYLFHRTITPEVVQTARFGSKIVNFGLILLWATGLGFLWHYQLVSPEKLGNPKIWAKLSIVVLLTLNGIAIHLIILPKLKTKIGSSLLSNESKAIRYGLLFSGAVSGVSWTMAMGLGAIKEINNIVNASTLLAIYVALLTVAFFIIVAISNVIEKRNFRFTKYNFGGATNIIGTTPGLLA